MPGKSRTTRASAISSSRLAWRDGTGWPSASLWVGEIVEEKPSAALAQRGREQLAHRVELRGGRLVADRALAHHHAAQRGVARP